MFEKGWQMYIFDKSLTFIIKLFQTWNEKKNNPKIWVGRGWWQSAVGRDLLNPSSSSSSCCSRWSWRSSSSCRSSSSSDHIGELEQVAVACDSIGKLFPGCFCPRRPPNSYTPKQASIIFIPVIYPSKPKCSHLPPSLMSARLAWCDPGVW